MGVLTHACLSLMGVSTDLSRSHGCFDSDLLQSHGCFDSDLFRSHGCFDSDLFQSHECFDSDFSQSCGCVSVLAFSITYSLSQPSPVGTAGCSHSKLELCCMSLFHRNANFSNMICNVLHCHL